ncbi:hypothetical protein WJX72_011099 [[Myrmecia] bisecta]|uniref:Translin-associated factor X-interacting protein 1 N-terminal domain-containing protein n=1 Tax=[Myrmecia] bisecta TaxID=41462 RepID=A0AAW1PRC4_9CHLO
MDESQSAKRIVSTALKFKGDAPKQPGTSGTGFLEVYPKGGSKQPKLLEQLQAMLAEKLREAEKLAAPHTPGSRSSTAATGLQLHVHRQVFDSFIQGFAAYQPLLYRIKAAYDGALDDALHCAHENSRLRTELAAAAQRHAAAVQQARIEAGTLGVDVRVQLNGKIGEAEARLHAAETRLQKSKAQAVLSRAEVEAAKAEVVRLQQTQRDLQVALDAEASWRHKEQASAIAVIPLCPYRRLSEDQEAVQRGSSTAAAALAAVQEAAAKEAADAEKSTIPDNASTEAL